MIRFNNPEDICEINISDKYIENWYTYYPEKIKRNIFGKTIIKKAKIENFFGKEVKISELKKYLMISNNCVYVKPNVTFIFKYKNIENREFYFDTIEEAKKFVDDFLIEYNLNKKLINFNK